MSLRSARWALALIGGLAGLSFGALPAQAQGTELCGDIEDMADQAFETYLEELDEEFALDLGDEKLCESLTKNFIKACQTAVKDSVKCFQNQIKSLSKQDQTACKALAGSGVSECVTFYKNREKSYSNEVQAIGDDQSDDCETVNADEFFDICMFGI